jgi:methyl-accepting chemotaxis protein
MPSAHSSPVGIVGQGVGGEGVVVMDLSKALEAHAEWRYRLRSAIANKRRLDAQTVARDDACPLGKWLHGDAKASYSHLTSYERCVVEHARFHVEAGRVAEAINAGEYGKAQSMIGNDSTYTAASLSVGAAIKALENEASL